MLGSKAYAMENRSTRTQRTLAIVPFILGGFALMGCDQGEPTTPIPVEVPKDARPEEVTPGKPTPPPPYKKSSRLPGPPPEPPKVQ
jgi:hypothetical protein